MRVFGLSPQEIEQIKSLLKTHFGDLADARVYLFGSRVKGEQRQFSDIDIAIKSRSRDLDKRISLFQEDWEKSQLPYKADLMSWNKIFKPYLAEINKTKKEFWKAEDREVHPWRVCPYGQHWVVRHPRLPVGRQLQDVDGHCRKNPKGKDRLDGQEIDLISKMPHFQKSLPLPSLYGGKEKITDPDAHDIHISGWCKYWNEVLKPDIPITPNFVKALIESESRFNPLATAKNKPSIGTARGLIQLTEQTLRILKDRKGELKDHYVDLARDELFDPSKNICAGIRWLFRKREILEKRLGRSPEWVEAVVEYKGLGPDLKRNGDRSKKVFQDFLKALRNYQ